MVNALKALTQIPIFAFVNLDGAEMLVMKQSAIGNVRIWVEPVTNQINAYVPKTIPFVKIR